MESEPAVRSADEISEELGGPLSDAVSAWMSNSDHSEASWRKMMRSELSNPLESWLLGSYSRSMEKRGITPLGLESAKFIVVRAIADTSDIRNRLLSAPKAENLTAAGPWFLEVLLRPIHQSKIVASLLRVVGSIFEQRSVEVSPKFTGRRKWVTTVASSRHSHLNGVIIGPSEYFQVAPGVFWPTPRFDIQNASLASGCRCFLMWETTDGRFV